MSQEEYVDTIRKMAEEELGRKIKDEEWTPEVRGYWKMMFFNRNYSFVNESKGR